MKTHQQSQLDESSLRDQLQITQQLQKYKQQTEYVCLKLGVRDWMLFLTEVRTGTITRTLNTPNNINSKSISASTKPFSKDQLANQTKKPQSAIQILSDVLEVKTTKRNIYNQLNCNCESPIYSQERIKYIQGSESSRSQSSASLVPNAIYPFQNRDDPFTKYKIENLWTNFKNANQISLDEAIKNIEQFDRQKKETEGFDTFRKVNYDQKGREINTGEAGVKGENNYQNTAKKTYNKVEVEAIAEPSFERVDSEEWIKQSIDQDNACNLKEFLLAMQNTKLRRQIKHLQRMLTYYNDDK